MKYIFPRTDSFPGFLIALLVFLFVSASIPVRAGLLEEHSRGALSNVTEFVFAARKMNNTDGHWYANIGYYAHDPDRKAWREGAKLYKWNRQSGQLQTLLEDSRGGIRDPQVSYDGTRILFAYRKGGRENYLLHEINIDGSGLRQLTSGEYDDIEPTYLPDGGIVFVSTRCKRWVNCWLTQVATLHRCDPDGGNVRPISSNNEQDNTPWPLKDGRILYTRWEYVDRSQVDYHHLWSANADGTGQMIWYGNQHPGIVMIDAKPVPGSDQVIAIFSPGHGGREHSGPVALVDVKAGPDDTSHSRKISDDLPYRDPWAFSGHCFVAALDGKLVLMDDGGRRETIFTLPKGDLQAGMHLHEPRPVASREREPVLPSRMDVAKSTGRLLLADIYEGRNMKGVQRGQIKKLLVLESLPMPIHYTGGMDPISYGGTFTLERVVGTVPVEEDGSAFVELPALRSFFFVALDENDLSVKRMQSFLTVQPGETTSCVGCHEQRERAPKIAYSNSGPRAARRAPSRVEPIPGVPDVLDFPRDIQPILDEHCVKCHGYDGPAPGARVEQATAKGGAGPRAGRLILSGDRGPMFSHSYYMLTVARLFSDGRNEPISNYSPRTLGTGSSRILSFVDGAHYDVKIRADQKRKLMLWIETGAPYPGTYAALGTGMIGAYAENQPVETDFEWAQTRKATAVIASRCGSCHSDPSRSLPTALSDERGVSFWRPSMDDPRLNTSRHIVFNLSHPEKSLMLLAPLAETAGGWQLCRDPKTKARVVVFESVNDPDYQALLGMCEAGKTRMDQIKRFDMPGFIPRQDWVREMKRYGVIAGAVSDQKMDVYAVEQRYWESLWYGAEIGKK